MVSKQRRNFLPALVLNLLFWLGLLLIVLKLSPEQTYAFTFFKLSLFIKPNLLLFFVVLTLTLTLTLALLLGNTRRGFLLTLFLDGFLLLQLFKLTNWLTLVFLFLILLVIEIYFSRRKINL